MSDEEKRMKKQKIEDNRRLRALSQSLSSLATSQANLNGQFHKIRPISSDETCDDDSSDFKYSLNDQDRLLIDQIQQNYSQAVLLNVSVIPGVENPCLRHLNGIVDLLNEPAQISALRLITFFKLTPEFNVSFFFKRERKTNFTILVFLI